MRGRKPGQENVVPLTANIDADDHSSAGRARAKELKPRGMSKGAAKYWDQIAPILCNPTKARLGAHMVQPFRMACEALARFEHLNTILGDENADGYVGGETYEVRGRNGTQYKSRPEVAQRNEAFRQFLTLARDFGLTPAAERGLANLSQGNLPFGEDDFT